MNKENIVNIMRTASEEVFATMLGLQTAAGPSYEEENMPTESEGVVALIGLAGPYVGTGIITCSPAFACKISSIMLMSEFESVNGEVLDAMAEIANMIFGNVKTALEEELGPLGLSIPTVIFGRNFSTKSVGNQLWTVVPLECEGENMQLKFFLTRNSNDSSLSARPGFSRPYAVHT